MKNASLALKSTKIRRKENILRCWKGFRNSKHLRRLIFLLQRCRILERILRVCGNLHEIGRWSGTGFSKPCRVFGNEISAIEHRDLVTRTLRRVLRPLVSTMMISTTSVILITSSFFSFCSYLSLSGKSQGLDYRVWDSWIFISVNVMDTLFNVFCK